MMTSQNNPVQVKQKSWSDVKEQVALLNPALAKAINSISPDDSYRLYELDCPYGHEVLVGNDLQLIDSDGQLKSIRKIQEKQLLEDLSYNSGSNPVALILEKSFELFMKIGSRHVPYTVASPGSLIGTWKLFDGGFSHCPETFLWGMTAGARSTFMLSSISNKEGIKRLAREFKIAPDSSEQLFDHWKVFKDISGSANTEWNSKLLFFSKKWFKSLDDSAFTPLRDLLIKNIMENSAFWRNQHLWNAVFSEIQYKLNPKIDKHVVDNVKHIFIAGLGALPGFAPQTDDTLLPLETIQEAYVDVYKLKTYAPIMRV